MDIKKAIENMDLVYRKFFIGKLDEHIALQESLHVIRETVKHLEDQKDDESKSCNPQDIPCEDSKTLVPR